MLRAGAIFLVCFLGIPGLIAAETSIFDFPLNDTGRSSLTAVCANIAANPVVRGNFSQTKALKRIKKTFNSQGRFLFSTLDGVLWQVDKPYPSIVIMTKDRLVQKTPGGKTSVMEGSGNLVFQRFADTLQAVFAGRLANLEKDFTLYFQGDEKNWRIGLIPKEESVRAIVASMEIVGDTFIRSLRLAESSGDFNNYAFSGNQAAASINAEEKQLFQSTQP